MPGKPYTIAFDISMPVQGYHETVTITVASGEPTGEPGGKGSFVYHMMQSLREWYDGGRVERTR